MTWPELPPRAEVLDMLRDAVAPTLGGMLGVCLLILIPAALVSKSAKWNWRTIVGPISVLALAAGLVAGNHIRGAFGYDYQLWTKWWHWAWPALGLALLTEFLMCLPRVPAAFGNLLRGVAAGVITWAICPPIWQGVPQDKWILPMVALRLALQWASVSALGRSAPGGASTAAMAVVALGAVAILMHHQWNPTGTTLATVLATALTTLAILAWWTKSDTSPAAAVATVPIITLLLLGRALQDSLVPRESFVLVAVAPLALALFLLPGLSRLSNHRLGYLLPILLVTVPVALAVYWAMEAAPLKFEMLSEAEVW